MVYKNSLIKLFISYFFISFIYSKCCPENKSQKDKKCSGVNKNKDTEQNGEKDNNEDEQNKDKKKVDPYEAKKNELIDRLNNLDAENGKLTSPIKKDIDTLKNDINAIKSNDDVTLVEFKLTNFETSINNAKEKEEAEKKKEEEINEKNKKLKEDLISLTDGDNYKNMTSVELESMLKKTLTDNYKDDFTADKLSKDNKDLIEQIEGDITAAKIKEIEEENKNKTKEELEKKLTNSLNEFKDDSKGKKSFDMEKELRAILDVPTYVELLKDDKFQELVKEIQKMIEVKKEEEKKKKEEEEKMKKEEEEKKQRELEEGRTQYTNIEKFKNKVEKIENDCLSSLENIIDLRSNCNAIRKLFGGIKNAEYKKNIEQFLNKYDDNYINSKVGVFNTNINISKNHDAKRRKKFLEELDKNKKYEKTVITKVNKSKYVIELYNVPFLSSYHGVADVRIPFAFELTKDYEGIFPEEMRKIVNAKLSENDIDKDKDFHIFFCYQYFVNTNIEDIDAKITNLLFRPHYFIAKKEIDECTNRKEKPFDKKFIYNPYGVNRKENICVVFGNNKCLFNNIIKDFALHEGCLSTIDPIVGFISRNTVNNIPVFYSFVLEKEKKIAAMTIHFFKFIEDGLGSNINDEIAGSNLTTIESAINFASTHNDTDVVDFLKGIIK